MKRIVIVVCGWLIAINSFAQLSDQSTIGLITCEPGPNVYAKFGHTAIRICDPQLPLDIVFHYGIFDFSSDHFIALFVKGETDYQLGSLPFRYFMPEYQSRNSTVYEQLLNLTTQEKQLIYNALLENYRPENRIYRYNFIFDNCATRPFYLILNNQSEKITFDLPDTTTTYRNIIEEYVGYNNWLRFGIDLVVSSLSDQPIGIMETVAFPLYTKYLFDHTYKTDTLGTKKPLVTTTETLFEATPQSQNNESPFLISPIFIMILLTIAGGILFFIEWKQKCYYKWFDIILFLIIGLAGSIIFYLMFFSIHPVVKENFNLLWCNPLSIVAAICLCIKPTYRILSYYFILYIICCLATLIIAACQIQILHAAFIPLIALLIIRGISFIHYQKNGIHAK
ncbi:MAG: DUF4105 domain-containing protein [Sphingobacteriia bacterium]|jgi:hypothetical protein|nr:DUF4105 domain-containing protein [Sphingobacteriia bacterium]